MSDVSRDPFVYPGTSVLQNKLDIRDQARLSYYEGAYVGIRLRELNLHPLQGRHDLAHLQAIHRHLFQDIYPWAGVTRENLHLGISKARPDGSPVSYPTGPMAVEHARRTLAAVKIEELRSHSKDALAMTFSKLYSELDFAHVFREGNSRTLRVFMSSLARDAGHTLTWEHLQNRQEETYRARDFAAFAMPKPGLPDPLLPLAALMREGLDVPAPTMSRTVAARIEAIKAYAGDGRSEEAPPVLRGVLKHLDKLHADIAEMTKSPKEADAMFQRVRERVADQFAAGYKFPDSGAAPTKSAPRSRGRDDERDR